MEIRPIRTKKEHAAALAEVERLIVLDPERGTPEGDHLEVLSILVERYEKEHFPIAPPTPIDAIEFHMDRLGFRQADLVPMIGSRGRVSEVLSGSRQLTIPMIQALHAELGIPLESLLPRARVRKAAASKPKAGQIRIRRGGSRAGTFAVAKAARLKPAAKARRKKASKHG